MKQYQTNFSKGAIDHWSNHQAVREFSQNWLDSSGVQEFEIGEDYISLTNKGVEVSSSSLLMGMSDKKSDPTKRGNYGTGSSFALCVLTARDIEVIIYNNDKVWTPSFEKSDQWGEEVLVIQEVACDPTGDYTVVISGLSEDDINDIRQTTLIFQDRKVLASTEYGDIIESVDDQGEVHCGDLFVQQTNGFKYSYNIKPQYLKLNQDRASTSEWDLQGITAKLIMSTGDDELIKEAIAADKLDTKHVAYYPKTVPSTICEEMGEEFIEEHGNASVTNCYSTYQEDQKLGNKTVYIANAVEVASIKQSTAYKEALEELDIKVMPTPDEIVEQVRSHVVSLLSDENVSTYCKDNIEEAFDELVSQSESWSGDTEELPF